MLVEPEASISDLSAAPARHEQASFPWKPALLIGLLLFFSENHPPAEVIDGNSAEYLVQMQGSLLRQFTYFLLGFIGIVYLTRAKAYRLNWRSPVTLAWVPLIAWCTLSISWADEPATSLKRIIAYLLMVAGAAGVATAWSQKQILQFVSFTGAVQLTVGIVAEMITGYFTPWSADYRFAGTQPWNVEGLCCVFLVLSSLAAADADVRHKRLFWSLSCYGFLFLLLTRSRSSLLGVTAGVLTYLLLSRSLTTKVGVGLSAGITLLVVYMSGLSTTLVDFLSRGGEGTTDLTGRQPLWELAQTFAKARPFTGYGYHDFWTTSRMDYFATELHWEVSSAHSSYLDSLLTLGWTGLVLHTLVLLFGVFYGSFLFRKHQSPIFGLAAALSLVLLVVGYLEAAVFTSPGPYAFGFTLLLCVLCFKPAKSDLPSTKEDAWPADAAWFQDAGRTSTGTAGDLFGLKP